VKGKDMPLNLNRGDTRLIIEACKKAGLSLNQTAYVLATAWHESAHTMKPVRETLATTDAQAKARLTKAFKAGKLPGVKRDYWSGGYYGRGHTQVTHEPNYAKASKIVGVDLVGNPDRMMEPSISIAVMLDGMVKGWFRAPHSLARYITPTTADFRGARNIINGDVKKNGGLIAGYAREYAALLVASGYEAAPKKDDVKSTSLTKGDTGKYVVDLQNNLNLLGYELAVTGTFDDATVKAVKAFQADKGLTVDGHAGIRTNTAVGDALKTKEVKPKIATAKRAVAPVAQASAINLESVSTAAVSTTGSLSLLRQAVEEGRETSNTLANLGPWVLLAAVVAGIGGYLLWKQYKQREAAKVATEALDET
jgi:peptidoglycan hydrolase-like protein with peptidoglycan-binding domain/predicted chitinase